MWREVKKGGVLVDGGLCLLKLGQGVILRRTKATFLLVQLEITVRIITVHEHKMHSPTEHKFGDALRDEGVGRLLVVLGVGEVALLEGGIGSRVARTWPMHCRCHGHC